jgi:cysteine desulfuration protein SufE
MLLLDYAKKIGDDYPVELKTEDRQVRGCTSLVYLDSACRDGRMHFRAFADAQIVKGMVGVLVDAFEGEPAEVVAGLDPGFIRESGIAEALTSQRQGGFFNIFARMQHDARQCLVEPSRRDPS